MYLSKLFLNPASRDARRDIANCHDLHRTIMSAYKDIDSNEGSARANFNVLHRLEANPRYNTVHVLVQSSERPDWSSLPGGYLLEGIDGSSKGFIKDISFLQEKIGTGSTFRFRLRANPTKREAESRKRVPLRDYQDRIAWLKRKETRCGFKVQSVTMEDENPDVLVRESRLTTGWKKEDKETHKLTFEGVLFDGYLNVTEKEKFLNALAKGIGSGKAYGFGLLSIAPVKKH